METPFSEMRLKLTEVLIYSIVRLRSSRKVNEAKRPHTCSSPCAFGENKIEENQKRIRPTENAPRNPQEPGDRIQLETTCEETRPTR